MISRSKHEAKADLAHAARHLLWAKVDTRSQGLQYIRAATATGGGPIAMSGHRCARRRSHDTGRRRDAKCARAVTTCATRIQRVCCSVLFQMNLDGIFE